MSVTTATNSVPFGAITIYRLINKIESSAVRFGEWNAKRKTAIELSKLSASQLEDIGVNPGEIQGFIADLFPRQF